MYSTLGEVNQDLRIKAVLGVCPGSPEGNSLVNRSCQRIMLRGDFAGTVVPMKVCVYAGCVVFPRFVGAIRKINLCRHPLEIRNFWHGFFEKSEWRGNLDGWFNQWSGSEFQATPGAKSPVFQDIMADGRLIRAYPLCQADVGKTIKIFGIDTNGQPLMTNNADGTWSDGITLTLAIPFASTSISVRRIDRILKDVTQKDVYLFAYDPVAGVDERLGNYAPTDINPAFVRYRLNISRCHVGTTGTTGNCGDLKSIMALVKLRFIAAVSSDDLVLIDNMDALADMIVSIKKKDEGDLESAVAHEKFSIREMNLQLRDEFPDDQIPVDFGETGGTSIGRQQCF